MESWISRTFWQRSHDATVPYLWDGYYYYARYEEGKEYAIYCRKKGSLDAPEEIMVDANELAEGHDCSNLWASINNQIAASSVAWSVLSKELGSRLGRSHSGYGQVTPGKCA